MKTLIFTVSGEEDSAVSIPNQILYYYDDGTYTGVVNKSMKIDFSITYKWEVREGEIVYFQPQGKNNWYPMSRKSSQVILDKITEFYLLKESNSVVQDAVLK